MAPRLSAAAAQRARSVPLVIVGNAERDAAYGRVSTDLQKEAETINAQKTVLLKDITVRDDPSLPITQQRRLVAQFWDDGISGTIPLEQRPEGRQLVSMVCERGDIRCEGQCRTPGQIDVVWATKLDRLARKLQILIQIEGFLRAHGVALRVLEFNIDTSTPMGTMIFTILGAINQWEREVILERTNNGRRQKAAEGKFVGGRRTFGLKTDAEGHLIVDEALVAGTNEMAYRIVQQIFENVAYNGSSAFREAQRWGMTDRRVQLMLHNPRYKGMGGMISGGTEWIAAEKNPPPTIVSPETWELAQSALVENQKNSSRNRHYDYLLTRLLVCAEPYEHTAVVDDDGVTWGRPVKTPGLCGRIFAGRIERRQKYGTTYVYYYCSRPGCTAKMLRGAETEDAVWRVVEETLRDPQSVLAEALDQRSQEETLHRIRTEMAVILETLARLDAEKKRVVRNGEKGLRTEAEVDQRLREIDAETAPILDQKAALDLQFRSANRLKNSADLASITSADIAEQLDLINAGCTSTNAVERRKARQMKAAQVRAAVTRIEVRTGEDNLPALRVFLRVGGYVSVGRPSCQEALVNTQDRDQNGTNHESFGTEVNPQEGEEFIIVREIVVPPSPRKVSRLEAAYGIV
jgi:site-specific DNA recombinase